MTFGSISSLKRGRNSELRMQRYLRVNVDLGVHIQRELVALPNGGKDGRCFGQCEVFADALSLSASEREIGKSWETLFEIAVSTFRTEPFWIRKVLRIAVADPLAQEYRVATLHPIST